MYIAGPICLLEKQTQAKPLLLVYHMMHNISSHQSKPLRTEMVKEFVLGFRWRSAWQVDDGSEVKIPKQITTRDEVSAWDVCVQMKMKHACGGGHHGGPAPAM
jgi:uncharacterized protein (DUF2249 family)